MDEGPFLSLAHVKQNATAGKGGRIRSFEQTVAFGV